MGSVLRTLPLIVLSSTLIGCSWRAGFGNGQVIDYSTKEPIPHAIVTVTCTIMKPIHGSLTETYFAESREPDGVFHIDPLRLSHCDFFYAKASKPGYSLDSMTDTVIRLAGDDRRFMPKIVYLVNDRDLVKVKLDDLLYYITGDLPAPGPFASEKFASVYASFVKSTTLAATPELAAWVRTHYCARLRAWYDVLSAEQRSRLNVIKTSPLDWSQIELKADSYETRVRPYCWQ